MGKLKKKKTVYEFEITFCKTKCQFNEKYILLSHSLAKVMWTKCNILIVNMIILHIEILSLQHISNNIIRDS